MKSTWISFVSFITLFVFLYSCNSDKETGFERVGDVSYKVHYRANDSRRPNDSDWVTVVMNYRLEDTVLFKSSNLDKPLRFAMMNPSFKGDLYEGLKLMGEGDSMTFAIVADSFFYKTAKVKKLPSFVEAGSNMYYDVKLINVISHTAFIDEMDQEKKRLGQQELIEIENYVDENNIKVQPSETGLYFISLEKGYGKKPKTGDMCRVYLEVKQLDGTQLFSNFNGKPIDVEYGKNFDTEGLMEGLGMIREGGMASLIVPSSIGVGETGKEGVDPFTTLLYKLKLDTIRTVEVVQKERAEKKRAMDAEKKRMKAAEQGKIDKYLVKHNIKQQPLESGVYFIETFKTDGEQPKSGDKIRMHYTMYLTNNAKIESTYNDEPIEFILGQGRVIRGWDQTIPLMTVGSKATLIIPSRMGYGSRQHGKYVEPYSPLVFEVELVEIVK